MPHRDDIEAAQQRTDALERELRDARELLEGLKGNAPTPPPPRSNGVFIGIGFVVLAGGGAMAFLAWQVQAQHQREARFEAQRSAQDALADARRTEVARVEREAAIARARAQEAETERLAGELWRTAGSTLEITWRGAIVSTRLPGLRTGDACVLTGEFSGGGAMTQLHGLTLRCGAVEAYRKTYTPPRPAGGLRRGAVRDADTRVFLFNFDDIVTDGRMVTLSTLRHSLVLTGRGEDSVDTTVFLRDVSDPTRPAFVGRESRARTPDFAGVREEQAQVVEVTGRAAVRQGERCVVQVRPVWEVTENCRITVRCESTWLYGAGEAGYLTCAIRDARAEGALDVQPTSAGGDPRLEWVGRRVVISDVTESGAWDVTLGW